ncbi:bifunctional 4-hydroxy-2-oxoglutarate aldolase/2-dehydro-3-deoxy-phosphogluconate aldolase [Luteimicrobium subarcticum]|uniref:2-dehydro-3-deoxy-phosphogluconate aldolase n=1 Tax=Luteimicrobium subarcticum TaxID=620910 RepID=A0A2M8WUU4_9MICO|nr:bifunctional 4-hydroxy-2-oxoglutarate aldolase/2-dehydro-3-deoxy-phosphogluconate aldolase [Luteimicrobium subarcticum]PJI94711.1 2-dehydro-3-deoxyphosphogluconate aldolase/(4S)-4-hydroxy-2-oxoglutarate aldolase [Luteimicrobium subarcticum]
MTTAPATGAPVDLSDLGTAGVVPVLVVDDAATGLRAAAALADGGLPVVEVTFRTAAARDALAAVAAERPDVLVGAGTVITAAQVDAAVDAGARFVVSPGLSVAVVERCRERGVPVLPGVATATDVITALDLGLHAVKLFPASVVGGPSAVKALSAPFPGLRFVPTGGIDASSAGDYLALPSVLAVGGSWMVEKSLLAAGDFDEVARRARAAVEAAAAARPTTGAGTSAGAGAVAR